MLKTALERQELGKKRHPFFFNGTVAGFNGTGFFSTVPFLGATVLLLVQRVTNKSHYQCT